MNYLLVKKTLNGHLPCFCLCVYSTVEWVLNELIYMYIVMLSITAKYACLNIASGPWPPHLACIGHA